jgi:hypothetical protein
MKKVAILHDHLEYFTGLWYILWPFGNLVVYLYIFPHFGILNKEKSGNPARNRCVMLCHTMRPKSGSILGLSHGGEVAARVARWFVFKPKIQIWVNFGGSCDGR